MADSLNVKLVGLDELKRALSEASVTIRTKAVRGALREAGKVIQVAARAAAPVLAVPTRRRTPGTVKKNIVVRASKFARQAGDEGVYINVRGIRGRARVKRLGKAGASNPNDPYYWRFVEMGTRKMAAHPFLRPAASNKGQEAINKFMQSVVPQIEKLNSK
jgi:HK97 gp10 family phage protein